MSPSLDVAPLDHAVMTGKLSVLDAAALVFEALGMPYCRELLARADLAYYGRPPTPNESPDHPNDSARQVDVNTLRLLGYDLTGKRRKALWKAADDAAKAAQRPSDSAIVTAVDEAYTNGHKMLAADQDHGAFVEAAKSLHMCPIDVQKTFYRVREVVRKEHQHADLNT